MAEIVFFIPKAEKEAKQNLADFIELCRDRLTVFGEDLDWNSNAWPKVVNFTVKGAPSRGYRPDQILNAEILPFAKAYVQLWILRCSGTHCLLHLCLLSAMA